MVGIKYVYKITEPTLQMKYKQSNGLSMKLLQKLPKQVTAKKSLKHLNYEHLTTIDNLYRFIIDFCFKFQIFSKETQITSENC